mgnify:CR=1 FL=1|tara:strand:- start:1987 stop:2286 length:300 start_codon:yes stop_codon:yes gene_type:complete
MRESKKIEVFCLYSLDSDIKILNTRDLSVDGYFSGQYILVGKGTCVLEPTDADLNAELVKGLEKTMQKERADSQVRIEKIQEKIQSLLAIENHSELESE